MKERNIKATVLVDGRTVNNEPVAKGAVVLVDEDTFRNLVAQNVLCAASPAPVQPESSEPAEGAVKPTPTHRRGKSAPAAE